MRVFRSTYRDRSGKKCRTAKWYVETRDHLQRVRRFPAFPGKKESEALGRQIEKLVVCKMSGDPLSVDLMQWLESIPAKMRERFVKIGLLDPARGAAGKLLCEHIADFGQSLLDKGNTRKQARLTVSRVRRIVKNCKFTLWTDVAASKVQRCIAKMQEEGLSKKTANYYLKACKHFARWMVEDRRAATSPIAHLRAIEVSKKDIRRPRRPLEADEVRRLLEATQAAGPRFKLPGYERSMIYRLAVESGLRANEIRLLKVASFDFDNCTVIVQDHTAKNRHEKTLPLRPDTAAEIKELLASKLPAAQAFKVPGNPANMLKPDPEAAGIDYQDDAGRYADFHSLRHTTGSLLAAAGVHPKIAQEIMRHSDINLTMSLYTHTLRGQEADAVNSLPDFSLPSSESQKKTGTDDVSVLASCLALSWAQHSPTMTPGEKANVTRDIVNGVFEQSQRGASQQATDIMSAFFVAGDNDRIPAYGCGCGSGAGRNLMSSINSIFVRRNGEGGIQSPPLCLMP